MSKIERIELYHIEAPLKSPFWPAWIPGYPQTHQRFTLLRLFTDDGYEGISAGHAFSKEREGLGDLLGGFLIGVQADDIDTVRKRIREASYLGWRNWWLEAAFWDLKGKIENKPVYKLLQNEEKTVTKAKIYASSGTLKPFDERKKYLDDIRSMGVNAIKLRVKDPERKNDIRIVEAVRREVGDDFIIGVDANQGWPVSLIEPNPLWDLEYATEFGKACDDLGVAWLEEPLDMYDWDGMAELRKRIKTPVSGGELHGGYHEIRPLFEHECLDKYQPDAMFCGGLTVSKMVMEECERRGLHFSPHTWTNALGMVVNLHAFAAWNHEDEFLEYPYEPPGIVPEEWASVINPIDVNPDGTIDVPQSPGLGVKLDMAKVKRFGKRFYTATPFRIAIKTIREKGLKTALELKKKKERNG